MNMAAVLDALWQEFRRAVRMLRQSPGFTAVAVLCLAFGIGVNTTMFTVINAVLLRSLPYPDAEQLVRLVQNEGSASVRFAEYEFVKEQTRSFASVTAYRGAGERRVGTASQDWVPVLSVSADFLRTLGMQARLGREFSGDETRAGGTDAAILSDALWRRLFGADPDVLGRSITLNDVSFTIIGVLPAEFWFPQAADVLIPLRRTGGLADLGLNTDTVARLRSGADVEQARAELAAMTTTLREVQGGNLPGTYRGLMTTSYQEWVVGDVRLNLLLLFGATGFVLLIACANLAMLVLTRFVARGREIAVRLALGAGFSRIFTQFLTENLVLAMIGATAGLVAAYLTTEAVVAWLPFNVPSSAPIRVDLTVLGLAVAVSTAAAIVFTLVSVLSARRLNVQESLRSDGKHHSWGTRARTRQALTIAEVALSTALLVVATLLIQNLYRMQQEPLGFTPQGLVTFETPFTPERVKNTDERLNFTRALLERLRQIPGVRGAAATNVLPLTSQSNVPAQRQGHPEQSIGAVEVRAVTPSYFEMMGISLQRGRLFTDSDAPTVPTAIINETLARRWWAEGDAVGDRLTIGMFAGKQFFQDPPREVIGVTGDTKTVRLQEPSRPTVFVLLTGTSNVSTLAWIVKTDGTPPPKLAEQIRAAVAAVDAVQRVQRLRTMQEIVEITSARAEFNAQLLALFSAVALFLAAVGLYGVLSFLVSQRRREIGTRMALGASRGVVLRVFLKQGLWMTGVGVIVGLAGALAMSRFLSTLLFGVQPDDPWSFGTVAVLLVLVGLAASYLPAHRAATTDPMVALRPE